MVEQVTNRNLCHMTVTRPYKQAFADNQMVKVGDAFNPFFAFYESACKYPVTTSDGAVVQVPAIKYLNQVKLGKVNSPNLATIAAEVATHYVMLCRELIMEEIRCDEFKGAPPSRQRCLYACDTLDEAQYWNRRIGENGTICELNCTGTIHRADSRLLLGDSEPLSVTRARARKYWRGEVGENPEFETLFVGEATVTGFRL